MIITMGAMLNLVELPGGKMTSELGSLKKRSE
jgi:hypothetical protein